MNFYYFHIGDYVAHTLHLSLEEDLIYRRLLDRYYITEKPLPLDLAALGRLIRLPADKRDLLEPILAEFFTRTDEGWRNKRADDEIAEMLMKQEASEEREEGKQTRLQRFRLQRAEMFQALQVRGIHPSWNIPMGELRRLFEANKTGPETPPETLFPPNEETAPETAPETTSNAPATTLPVTSTSTSTSKKEPPSGVQGGAKKASKKCPVDFEVSAELTSWAAEKVPGLDTAYETEKFLDYTFATARTDWPATWRQWMRKAYESSASNVLPINPARRV